MKTLVTRSVAGVFCVYANTKDALRQNPGAGFERQLTLLRSVPSINLRDGTVDCREAILRP